MRRFCWGGIARFVFMTEQEFIKSIKRSNLLDNLFQGILIAFEITVCIGSLYVAFNNNITSKSKSALIVTAIIFLSLLFLTLIGIKSRNKVLHISNEKSKEENATRVSQLKKHVQVKNHYQFENHSSIEIKAKRLLILECEVLVLENKLLIHFKKPFGFKNIRNHILQILKS